MRRLAASWLWVAVLVLVVGMWWCGRAPVPEGVVVLRGAELTAPEFHLVVGADPGGLSRTVQGKIDEVLGRGGFPVVAHPWAWDGRALCGLDALVGLRGPFGVEVSPLEPGSLAIWDAMLGERMRSGGPPVWGVCSDDSHEEAGMGSRFVVARCARRDGPSVLEALRAGRFYSSTGPLLREVGVAGGRVVVALERPGEVRFVGPGGRLLGSGAGARAEYVPRGGEGYVRVEVEHAGGGWVLMQPFLVRGPGRAEDPYAGGGEWLRGNLHCHSSRSDGRLSFRAVVDWYGRHGFGFVCVSDHLPVRWTGLR